ncbi:hypothetical protein BD560DRAFT_47722 [Blakeslea trispora]|nr:hypothetical protein BD560DRAFT_47722 [Blakeslea trispora]
MVHTFFLLDGHPNVFNQTTRFNNEQVDPTQQLPLFPLWANMVQSTIEFCRVVWDLEHLQKYPINVFVAGATPILLNTIEQQHTRYLESQFPQTQPRHIYTHDRIQTTIESILDMYMDQNKDKLVHRCRIIILAVAKQFTEQSFEFRNNAEDSVRDLRLMACEAIEKLSKEGKKIDHVDIDVLRLLPFVEKERPLPKSILSKQITPQLTMSIHNIPNGQDDLKYAMKHLAQLYYNIHVLHISNIPMKSTEQVAVTRTVTLFYQANGLHLIDQKKPISGRQLHHPAYLEHRELELTYSKRSKRALPEHEWCTCMHSISPLYLYDLASEVFLDMTLQGSISYLIKDGSVSWSHVLMAHHEGIFLHCLDSQLHDQFAEIEKDGIQSTKVKIEGKNTVQPTILKTSELVDTVLRPNLFDNVHQYLAAIRSNSMCKTVPIDPFRFSHHLLITHELDRNKLHTSRSIEKSTRWRTCFRNCEGTDRFPVTLEKTESIEDLANDVLNGIPRSSGFGVAIGLVRDLFEQLQDVFVKDVILEKEVKPTKELISMLVSQLVQGMEGSQKSFIKGLSKQEARLVSKKLLVAFYLIGKRFSTDSEQHRELCLYIMSTMEALKEQVTQTTEPSRVKKEENVIQDVWSQVTRYENMSLREREEAAQGIIPDMKRPMSNEPVPFSNQLPPHLFKSSSGQTSTMTSQPSSAKINPAFRSRRGNNPIDPRFQPPPKENQPSYPDPSAAVPYLVYIRPTLEEKAEEEKAEEDSLGEPGNLLWLYWMHDKTRKRGIQEEGDLSSGTELVHKDHEWKRVKKEFLGRMALAGEKGETT